ncbi:hypothetical protein V9Z28_02205 [Streptococcus suis]|uniref:hypothetical protein n=1 Tax=Streptococcus suis TaxID=1307 RepID=UPI003010346C
MFQIEGKLFFRIKKNLVAILVMLMTILASSLLAGYHNRQAKLKVIQHYEQSIRNFENIIQDLETQYQNQTLSEEDYQAEQTFFTDYIANYQKEIEAVKKEDWIYFYEKISSTISRMANTSAFPTEAMNLPHKPSKIPS